MSAVIDEGIALAPSTDVDALLHYTRNTGVRPVIYTYEPPPGVPRSSGEVDSHTVTIHDARRVDGLRLDTSGFELLRHRSTLTEWASFQSKERVEAIDYPEVAAALKAHSGADKVLLFDHTLRDSTVETGEAALRAPVRRVHDDQTLQSAPDRIKRHLPPDEAARRLQRRFAIVNCWRPVGGPVLQTPLAVCDARTIDPDDLLVTDLVYPDWIGGIYSIAFNPRHLWYWYPRQTTTEATLIKVFDSATDGRARLSAHTAFDDPTSSATAPTRRSIEIRALIFW